MPNYKRGKIVEQLSFQEIQERVKKARKKITLEGLAFFWLLYYAGCRKSEAYERTVDDVELTLTHIIIDFHQRKKHGATAPPLRLPLNFPGMDILKEQLLHARKLSTSKKLMERSAKGTEVIRTVNGKNYYNHLRTTEYKRAHWLFPHTQKAWALIIIKKILGEKYYPHFLRLNRITELASDPEMNLTRLKSYTGIKSLDALQSYMGTAQKEQDAAMNFIGKQFE